MEIFGRHGELGARSRQPHTRAGHSELQLRRKRRRSMQVVESRGARCAAMATLAGLTIGYREREKRECTTRCAVTGVSTRVHLYSCSSEIIEFCTWVHPTNPQYWVYTYIAHFRSHRVGDTLGSARGGGRGRGCRRHVIVVLQLYAGSETESDAPDPPRCRSERRSEVRTGAVADETKVTRRRESSSRLFRFYRVLVGGVRPQADALGRSPGASVGVPPTAGARSRRPKGPPAGNPRGGGRAKRG